MGSKGKGGRPKADFARAEDVRPADSVPRTIERSARDDGFTTPSAYQNDTSVVQQERREDRIRILAPAGSPLREFRFGRDGSPFEARDRPLGNQSRRPPDPCRLEQRRETSRAQIEHGEAVLDGEIGGQRLPERGDGFDLGLDGIGFQGDGVWIKGWCGMEVQPERRTEVAGRSVRPADGIAPFGIVASGNAGSVGHGECIPRRVAGVKRGARRFD